MKVVLRGITAVGIVIMLVVVMGRLETELSSHWVLFNVGSVLFIISYTLQGEFGKD